MTRVEVAERGKTAQAGFEDYRAAVKGICAQHRRLSLENARMRALLQRQHAQDMNGAGSPTAAGDLATEIYEFLTYGLGEVPAEDPPTEVMPRPAEAVVDAAGDTDERVDDLAESGDPDGCR